MKDKPTRAYHLSVDQAMLPKIIANIKNIPIILDKDISVREFGEHKGKISDIDFDFTWVLEL